MVKNRHYKIGFSNVNEHNPFTVQVRENLEKLAAARDDITLIVRNNDQNTPRAIANSQEFADADVDVAIVFHIDERNNDKVVKPLRDKSIPIMCIDIPISFTVYFGLDNRRVGEEAGIVLANWINENWDGQIDKTLVVAEYRLLELFQQRFLRAVDMLGEHVKEFKKSDVLFLDNGGTPEITSERVAAVLDRWQDHHHIAVVCMNDDVAIGTLDAIYKRGRVADTALLSHDGTHVAIAEFEKEKSPLIVSTKLYPEVYGDRLIELAIRIADGEKVPMWNYADTIPLTRENFQVKAKSLEG